MAKPESSGPDRNLGVEKLAKVPGINGRSIEAWYAQPLPLRDRLMLRVSKYRLTRSLTSIREPKSPDVSSTGRYQQGRKDSHRNYGPQAIVFSVATIGAIGIGGLVVNELTSPESQSSASSAPGRVGPEGRAHYALDQSVEVVSDAAVADFATYFTSEMRGLIPMDDASKRTDTKYLDTAISAQGTDNGRYNFFINAPTLADGRPDVWSMDSVGVGSSIDAVLNGKVERTDVAGFSVIHVKNPQSNQDYWNIRVQTIGSDGLKEVTDYTTDQKVAQTPDTYATTTLVTPPNQPDATPERRIKTPLTPDKFSQLVKNGHDFLDVAAGRHAITKVNLNVT